MDNTNLFMNGHDDYMFPTTTQGLQACGMMVTESADETNKQGDAKNDEKPSPSTTPSGGMSVEAFATATSRNDAMSAVLTWIDEGEYSYDFMDELVLAAADLDGNEEISPAEEALYASIWIEVPGALLALGCDEKDVDAFVDGPGKEADEAAARLGAFLSKAMDEMEMDDSDIVLSYALGQDAVLESATGDDARTAILEATYRKKMVIRDGKKVRKNVRVSGRVHLSAAQKRAVKKMQRKAHTGAADRHRAKSMRKRQQMGL